LLYRAHLAEIEKFVFQDGQTIYDLTGRLRGIHFC